MTCGRGTPRVRAPRRLRHRRGRDVAWWWPAAFLLPSRIRGCRRRPHRVHVGRIDAEQMAHEKVVLTARSVFNRSCRAAGAMARAGDDQQVEILFALISALTTCIVDDGSTFVSSSPTTSSSLPCSLLRVVHVRRRGVVRADRPAHPLLVPPDLVHAVVVAAGVDTADLVELRVEEQRAGRVLSAGRVRRRCRRG